MIRFFVAEALLLAILVLLSCYLFLEPAGQVSGILFGLSAPAHRWDMTVVVGVALCAFCALGAVYGFLQRLGMPGLAFWMVALLVLFLQSPAVLAHNGIDWLWPGSSQWGSPRLPATTTSGLLLLSLGLLLTLNRVSDLRRLAARLKYLGLEGSELKRVVSNAILAQSASLAFSLVVTVLLLVGGVALAGLDGWLVRFPWTVLTIGGVAMVLLGCSVYFALRFRNTEQPFSDL